MPKCRFQKSLDTIYIFTIIYLLLLLLKKRIKSTNRHLIDNQGEKRLTCWHSLPDFRHKVRLEHFLKCKIYGGFGLYYIFHGRIEIENQMFFEGWGVKKRVPVRIFWRFFRPSHSHTYPRHIATGTFHTFHVPRATCHVSLATSHVPRAHVLTL